MFFPECIGVVNFCYVFFLQVDTGPVNPLTSGSQDSISKVGAHAALLSAANAGAGYMAFA